MSTNPIQPSQQVPVAADVQAAALRAINLNHTWMLNHGPVSYRDSDLFKINTQSIAALQSAPDAGLAEDAKRYRYACEHGIILLESGRVALIDKVEADRNIDAALASQEPQHG